MQYQGTSTGFKQSTNNSTHPDDRHYCAYCACAALIQSLSAIVLIPETPGQSINCYCPEICIKDFCASLHFCTFLPSSSITQSLLFTDSFASFPLFSINCTCLQTSQSIAAVQDFSASISLLPSFLLFSINHSCPRIHQSLDAVQDLTNQLPLSEISPFPSSILHVWWQSHWSWSGRWFKQRAN